MKKPIDLLTLNTEYCLKLLADIEKLKKRNAELEKIVTEFCNLSKITIKFRKKKK